MVKHSAHISKLISHSCQTPMQIFWLSSLLLSGDSGAQALSFLWFYLQWVTLVCCGGLSIQDCQKRTEAWRASHAGSFYGLGLAATHVTSAHIPWARLSPVAIHNCKDGSMLKKKR